MIDIKTPDGGDKLARFYGRDLEEAQLRFTSRLAQEIADVGSRKGVLNGRRRTLWPQRTGFSRDRWQAEVVGDDIAVINTATYAAAVNNRKQYASGKPNKNYHSAQRTVEKWWAALTARAAKDI